LDKPPAQRRIKPSPPDDFDDLLNLPTDVAPDRIPRNEKEWLDALPTDTDSLSRLIDYPASYDGEESIPVHTRVAPSWVETMNRMRELPGTNLPKDIWPTMGSLFRWCIMQGMLQFRMIMEDLNREGRLEEPLDPILSTQIFLERTAGELAARSNAITDARKKASAVAEAVNLLVGMQEYAEAADMINKWIENAQELSRIHQSPFWERLMIKAIVDEPTIASALVFLSDHGHIVDEYVQSLISTFNLRERKPEDGKVIKIDRGFIEDAPDLDVLG